MHNRAGEGGLLEEYKRYRPAPAARLGKTETDPPEGGQKLRVGW